MHEEAVERLSGEIDILDFIKTSRILGFMTSYSLRRNQRQLVQYFSRYHLDPNSLQLPQEKPPQSTFEILEKFNPQVDKTDHRILFEIIQRKIDLQDENFDIVDEPVVRRQQSRIVRLGTNEKLARIFVRGSDVIDENEDGEDDEEDSFALHASLD